MVFEQIEKLKDDYTDKYVVVDATRPELARFAGRTGRVKTVNMSGRALVEFDGGLNIGWHDIALDFLKVVDKPVAPPPKAKHEAPAREKAPAAAKTAPDKPAAAAPAGKPSTADILAAARAKKDAGAVAPAGGAKKPSTADILAAARGKKAADAPTAAATPAAKPAAAPAKPASPGKKLSTADILAAARANKTAAAAPAEPPAAVTPAAPEAEEPAAVEAPVAVEEPPAEEPVVAAPPAAKPGAKGARPTTTADIIAWCREHDARK